MLQLEPHFYTWWKENIEEQQIFGDNEDPENWYISKDNADTFLECLDLEEKYLNSKEFKLFIG